MDDRPLIWVHGDGLDPRGPALAAYPDAPRVFVFDDAVEERYRLSLKRIVFLYECLLEIPGIEIRRGAVAAELADAAREHGCARIATTESAAPGFARIRETLTRAGLRVEILPGDPFVSLSPGDAARLDLKRFSRYWQKARGGVVGSHSSS